MGAGSQFCGMAPMYARMLMPYLSQTMYIKEGQSE